MAFNKKVYLLDRTYDKYLLFLFLHKHLKFVHLMFRARIKKEIKKLPFKLSNRPTWSIDCRFDDNFLRADTSLKWESIGNFTGSSGREKNRTSPRSLVTRRDQRFVFHIQ
jgi:hypothetical protein